METSLRAILIWLIGIILSVANANATTIDFTTIQIGTNHWRYDYTIHNDTLGIPIEEFTIFFDESTYANLGNIPSLAQWDLIALQPDSGIPADGLFDGLGLSGGIAAGATLSGLSVSFDYLGTGIPELQRFSIVDPVSFAVLDSGNTTNAAVALPLPDTLSLVGLGLLATAMMRRSQRSKQ